MAPTVARATMRRIGRILIVGAGGLGVPAARALARDGTSHITLIDPDPVELSNLARQTIYRTVDIGIAKVEVAARRLRASYPDLAIDTKVAALDARNAAATVASHDCVIDATDDPVTKFLINDVCVAARIPFVYGGVLATCGQAMTVIPGATACLRCLFEEPPDADEIASCREAGIVGPVAGAIGEVQAAEALFIARSERPRLAGSMLTYEATATPRVRVTQVAARPGCRCGAVLAGAGARSTSVRGL